MLKLNNVLVQAYTHGEITVSKSNLIFNHRKLSKNLTINLPDYQKSACGFYLCVIRFHNVYY